MTAIEKREANIKALKEDTFDLLIIGGGITGAGIALDAASRGMKVALIEKNDYAFGTSSKSTKLIHGGLRYLKQFAIGLVREVGQERAIVHQIAPHLVRPKKMLLPITKGGSYGQYATSIALKAYDYLAGVTGIDQRKMLTKQETLEKEPLLDKERLKAAGYYAEYRTDDARLTLAVIKKAREKGAICLNYMEASGFHYNEDRKMKQVQATDNFNDQTFTITAHNFVNATGPWVDELREMDNVGADDRLFLSKGIHIVVPHLRVPVNQAVYFDVGDQRMIFAIPRLNSTYIGTTDTVYNQDLDNIPVLKEEIAYLLAAANRMFPTVNLTQEDVTATWAGLRPLIRQRGKSAGEISRKDELFIAPSGLINIAGGKLTGYRKMAEKVIDKIVRNLDNDYLPIQTENILLDGAPKGGEKGVKKLLEEIQTKVNKLKLPVITATYLLENYGTNSHQILNMMDEFPEEKQVSLALIRAEARYCVENEQALTLMDFYNRRTGRLLFDVESIEMSKDVVLQDFAHYLNLDAFTQMMQVDELIC